MARHSYNIANATGAAVRADLNNALAAIQSVNSGSGAPSSTVAYQYFIDTSPTPSNPALIKQRNADNDGDILLGEVNGQAYFSNGTQSKPSISFRNDTNLGLRRNDADKLSIVTNGADRVTVSSSGLVGIGVTGPNSNLHVESTPNCNVQITSGTSGSSIIKLGDTDDANIGKIEYDNSSNSLAFDTNNSTRLTILSDGKCGIGETTPTELLHVAGNIKTTGNIDIASGNIVNGSPDIGVSGFDLRNDGVHKLGRYTSDGNNVLVVSGGSGELRVNGNGDCKNTSGTFTNYTSDERFKQDIAPLGTQWDDIKGVTLKKFRYKNNPTGELQLGVIAQELQQVCPGLVTTSNATLEDVEASGGAVAEGEEIYGWKMSILPLKAVKALQEAMDRIETLEAKVAALEAGN